MISGTSLAQNGVLALVTQYYVYFYKGENLISLAELAHDNLFHLRDLNLFHPDPPVLNMESFSESFPTVSNYYPKQPEKVNMIQTKTKKQEKCTLTEAQTRRGSAPPLPSAFNEGLPPLTLLHQQLAHASERVCKEALKHNSMIGLKSTYDQVKNQSLGVCDACELAKSRETHPTSSFTEKPNLQAWDAISTDIIGKLRASYHNNIYYILFIDHKTDYALVKFAKTKDQFLTVLQELFRDYFDPKGIQIKVIQGDSDTLFKDSKFVTYCNSRNISRQYSPPHKHAPNGKIERAVQTINLKASTMMIANKAPEYLWEYAVGTAVHVYNATPKRGLDWKTPFELVHGSKPDVSNFVPFYAPGFYHVYKEERPPGNKFQPHAKRCRFLGYPAGYKNSYIILNENGKILVRADCHFRQVMEISRDTTHGSLEVQDMKDLPWDTADAHPVTSFVNDTPTIPNKDVSLPAHPNMFASLMDNDDDDDASVDATSDDDSSHDLSIDTQGQGAASPPTSPSIHPTHTPRVKFRDNLRTTSRSPPPSPLRRSPRSNKGQPYDWNKTTKKQANAEAAYFTAAIQEQNRWNKQVTRAVAEYNAKHASYKSAPEPQKVKDRLDIREPLTVTEAITIDNPYHKEWLTAINLEMKEIWDRKIIAGVSIDEIEELGRTPFRSKFVFKVKKEPDGSLRFKARLVGKGCSQKFGIDYDETYAPTVGFHTALLLIHIAARKNWVMWSMDIGNAYLEASADKLLYMWLPFDYTEGQKIPVRIDGNLYGTKQAAKLWNDLFDAVLEGFGFIKSIVEPCLYIYEGSDGIMWLIIYVDDGLVIATSIDILNKLKTYLAKQFKSVKYQDIVRKFLGVRFVKALDEATVHNPQPPTDSHDTPEYIWMSPEDEHYSTRNLRGNNGCGFIQLTQDEYAMETAITTLGKNDNKQAKVTPLPPNAEQLKDQKDGQEKPTWDMVGKLRYLVDRTRPDLAYAASFLGRFTLKPTREQVLATERTIRYAKATKDFTLSMCSQEQEIKLVAYADAAFAKDDESKAQLGYCFFLSADSGAVLWKSMKDKSVSLSTTQAELHALVECAKAIVWYRELMKELGMEQIGPTVVYQDNENVITLVNKIANDNRTKYLINRINFIRELVDNGIIVLTKVHTDLNVSDILTKALDRQKNIQFSIQIRNGVNLDNYESDVSYPLGNEK